MIWSNVLIDENGVPHWTGNGEDRPERKGKISRESGTEGMKDENGKASSHIPSQCPLHPGLHGPGQLFASGRRSAEGAETRVITYSGRDSDTMPPVWVAKNSDQGVVIGACIVSAATATEVGATGVKRAPWANAPFIPGALGDYMDAQFKFFGSTRSCRR